MQDRKKALNRPSVADIVAVLRDYLPKDDNSPKGLLIEYAEVLRAGGEITPKRVNAAWKRYARRTRPDHPNLTIPFEKLSKAEQDKDRPYAEAANKARNDPRLKGRI